MAIARRLEWYLERTGVWFEVLPHPHSETSLQTAREARIPAERLAKPVLLEDEEGYLLAVLPATRRLDVRRLSHALHRHLELASEEEIGSLFPDCETGAMPPLGMAYQVPIVFDDALFDLPDVYFEAGDHEEVVHMGGSDFCGLLEGWQHGPLSLPD